MVDVVTAQHTMIRGDALDLIQQFDKKIDLMVTDPPYAFGGSGDEHELSATVAVVLREAAQKMAQGAWALVFCASSWRSISYMAEATRGILTPVRIGTWTKPTSKTRVATSGWRWASVSVLALRRGKAREMHELGSWLDHIQAEIVVNGRRAQLPQRVAEWAVSPFVHDGGVFLDPFAGSGVLGDVASDLGMDAYGFEKNIAVERNAIGAPVLSDAQIDALMAEPEAAL